MNTRPLLKSLTLVVASVLVAGVFHIGWLAAFIPAAKSGVMALKILGWLSAPVLMALGYTTGLWIGERRLTTRKTDFLRIFVWPLIGCSLGAMAVIGFVPMLIGFGMFVGGTASIVFREVKLENSQWTTNTINR